MISKVLDLRSETTCYRSPASSQAAVSVRPGNYRIVQTAIAEAIIQFAIVELNYRQAMDLAL